MDEASSKIVSRKIKTRDEVARRRRRRARDRRRSSCATAPSTSCIPGHVRHLIYAKSKADILIASLTADAHISQGQLPAVRAAGAARDQSGRARDGRLRHHRQRRRRRSSNIGIIQPDYLRQGLRVHQGRPASADARGEARRSRPTAARSSSRRATSSTRPRDIIETEPPAIAAEKLMALMEAEGLTFDDLRAALDSFKGLRVHVVGDTIVDSYTHSHADRRHDQDADHERPLRDEPHRLRRRCRHRRQASGGGRRRGDLLDRARRRRATRVRAQGPEGRRRRLHADHRPHAPDHQQERHHRRRLPPAQGRHARQPVDLRRDPASTCASKCAEHAGRHRACSAISATASSTATPFRR